MALFEVKTIKSLWDDACRKYHGPPPRKVEFGELEGMADAINEGAANQEAVVSRRYLYENLHRQLDKALASGEKEMNLNRAYVNKIAGYVGFGNFDDYRRQQLEQMPKEIVKMPLPKLGTGNFLQKLVGAWYSYNRNFGENEFMQISRREMSATESVIRSPWLFLANHESASKDRLEVMRGGLIDEYRGFLERKGYFVYILMDSLHNPKQRHFIAKPDDFTNPKTLFCVSTAISLGNEPIGLREVLVKQPDETDFNRMSARMLPIDSPEINAEAQLFLKNMNNSILTLS